MAKIIITIIMVNIEITIIQKIIFEFENMIMQHVSPQKHFVTEISP